MAKDFTQLQWDAKLENDVKTLVQLAIQEDLGRQQDWTTVILVPRESRCRAAVVTRQDGVLAGVDSPRIALSEIGADAQWQPLCKDGQSISAGSTVGNLVGSARDILTAERTVLNILCRLSGVASLTWKYCDQTVGTGANIYDTRKTTAGWRWLEKYAVRCGGGRNHRMGLNAAIMIKDNHLALMRSQADEPSLPMTRQAVRTVRSFLKGIPAEEVEAHGIDTSMLIEVEVDSLEQLESVLEASPDIILLDNMDPSQLRQAVSMRNRSTCAAELEASGGVSLTSTKEIAATGVERISVGALTHSAPILDLGLDWELESDSEI